MRPIPIAQYLTQLERERPVASAEAEIHTFEAAAAPARTPQAPQDLDALLAEAVERGRAEGEAATKAEWEEREAAITQACETKAHDERAAFQAQEIAKFADMLSEGLLNVERRIAEVVARILEPYLLQEQTDRVLDRLSQDLKSLLEGDAPPVLRITGPERLLADMHRRLKGQPIEVEYWADDVFELTVQAEDTRIVTQLQPWADLIHDKKA